jgi:hypothetical protein
MKNFKNCLRSWWETRFDAGAVHSVAAIALVVVTAASSGWLIDGCNEQNNDASNDAGIADPACVGTTACPTAAKHCKGRYNPLKNYRHEYLVAYWDGGLHKGEYPLYTAGSNHAWCWYANGPIYWRHSQLKHDVTSPWGGVDLHVDWWQPSICYNANHDCLYRVESLAHIGFDASINIGPISIGLHPNLTQYRCIATRISSGGSHHRVIYLGACPPPANARATTTNPGSATFAQKEGTLDFNGMKLKSANPALLKRLVRKMQSGKSLTYMAAHHDRPSPQVKALVRKVYLSLSADQRQQLQKTAASKSLLR